MFTSVLFYTNNLKPLKRFYRNVFGFDLKESGSDYFTVTVGETDITFREAEAPSVYHFAINIPGNQFIIIKDWLKQKVRLLQSKGKSDIYNPSLDADSMYFEDPAGNLVELIGRRKRDLFGSFTKEAFFDVSEVGIVTPYLYEAGEELQDLGLPLLRKADVDTESVNFLGKGDHYIILAPPAWKWRFSKIEAETHPLEITFKDGNHITLSKEGQLKVSEA